MDRPVHYDNPLGAILLGGFLISRRLFTRRPQGHTKEDMPEQITQLTPSQIYSRAYYEANKEKIDAKRGLYDKNKRRAYYEANKDKSRAYYEANKASLNEKNKAWKEDNKSIQLAWLEANKDSIEEKSRAWIKANKDSIKEQQRAWREAHPEHRRAWVAANPEKVQNSYAKRRANTIGEISQGWIPKLLELQRWTCIVCNKDLRYGYHIDHIYPVSKGGENTDFNLQALCPKCNREKSDKDPIDFMQSRGFLL